MQEDEKHAFIPHSTDQSHLLHYSTHRTTTVASSATTFGREGKGSGKEGREIRGLSAVDSHGKSHCRRRVKTPTSILKAIFTQSALRAQRLIQNKYIRMTQLVMTIPHR